MRPSSRRRSAVSPGFSVSANACEKRSSRQRSIRLMRRAPILENKMRTRKHLTRRAAALTAQAFLLLAGLPAVVAARAASDEASQVRGVVEQVFNQLKSGQYEALYDALPAASRKRISRERFTSALRRTEDMYKLDRLEIGQVRVSGDIATADTVMYGRLLRPVESDGKIVAQQYLVREDGRWPVATGDRATIPPFLHA